MKLEEIAIGNNLTGVEPTLVVTPPGPKPLEPPSGPGPKPPIPPGPGTKAKSFHGSADMAPSAAKFRLVQIADEIIALLNSDPNVSVKINVEISADFPDGATDQIKRAVSENAKSLNFGSAEWE